MLGWIKQKLESEAQAGIKIAGRSINNLRYADDTTLMAESDQALSMGFSRQEYWSGLPFPSPGDLPNPGTEPESPAFAGGLYH